MDNKKLRILIADDEPTNLQLMRQILSEQYQLAFAANGYKALEILDKLEIDLILLDIMMPEIDGYDVCRALKANEKTKNIPVIFVTAKDAADDETKGFELGAVDYITKPIKPSIVKARVKNHLELKLARERIEKQNKMLEDQNKDLIQAARLREDVDRITRHDMKNPLNAVIGLSQILKHERNFTDAQKANMKLIEQAGYNLLNMINLSLDLFKMERGVYQFDPEQINIIKIISKILNEIQILIASKRLSASVLINEVPANERSELFVQGEKLLCYSMLMNLIKNAVEASSKESPITIRCGNDGSGAFICIHNKGAVPEDIRDHFFDKYITSGKKGGTGLGTYSAKLIAETQGGSIVLNTSEDNATTVIVRMKQ